MNKDFIVNQKSTLINSVELAVSRTDLSPDDRLCLFSNMQELIENIFETADGDRHLHMD